MIIESNTAIIEKRILGIRPTPEIIPSPINGLSVILEDLRARYILYNFETIKIMLYLSYKLI